MTSAEAGPRRRETYRHGDLHRALVKAGAEMAREGGPQAMVLRETTRRGYSTFPRTGSREYVPATRAKDVPFRHPCVASLSAGRTLARFDLRAYNLNRGLSQEGGFSVEMLAIGEVARRAGVSASAIRYYERTGLVPEPGRVGGKRRYEPEVLRRLALIEAAKRAGLTIAEIRTLLHGYPDESAAPERWRSLASRKLEEVDELMARLGQMRVLCSPRPCGANAPASRSAPTS